MLWVEQDYIELIWKIKKSIAGKKQIKAYGVIINTNRINAALLGEKDGLFSKGHYGALGHNMKQIVRMNQEVTEYGCKEKQDASWNWDDIWHIWNDTPWKSIY